MNATHKTPTMSKDVFKALLLIYASYTDLEFSSVEKDEIVNLLGHKNFHSANQLYSNFREYELLKNICNFRQLYYPGNEGKDQVLGMVKTHFMADGDFSKLERTQYDFLRMML